jgi:exonuclease VII small subunit
MVQRDSLKAVQLLANSNFNQKSNELNALTERLEWQIVELENKIFEIKMQYEQRFNEISKKHEARHGHMITNEYKEQINSLENWKVGRIAAIENNLAVLENEKVGNPDLLTLKKSTDSLKQIVKENNQAFEQTNKQVNDLEKQMQQIETELDLQLKDLSEGDKVRFIEQRQKLKQDPCNQ